MGHQDVYMYVFFLLLTHRMVGFFCLWRLTDTKEPRWGQVKI